MDMTQHSQQEVPSEQNWPVISIISLEEQNRARELALFSPALGQSQMGTDLPSPNSPAKAGVMAWLPGPGAGSTAFTTTEPSTGRLHSKPFGEMNAPWGKPLSHLKPILESLLGAVITLGKGRE